MDLRDEVDTHGSDAQDVTLQQHQAAIITSQHSLLEICDIGHALPMEVYRQKTAKRIYTLLKKGFPSFPIPTPTLYLESLVAQKRDQIVQLWEESVKQVPQHGYRKLVEGQMEMGNLRKLDRSLTAFLKAIVILGNGTVASEEGHEFGLAKKQSKHAYLLEQITKLPPPQNSQELIGYWKKIEQMGILAPLFLWPEEREYLGGSVSSYINMAKALRLHPTSLAHRPMKFSDEQKLYNSAIYEVIAPAFPSYIHRRIDHVTTHYCYRMENATMIKTHQHYQDAQKSYGSSPFEGTILLREMLITEYMQSILGDLANIKRASNYDDKEHGVDFIAYTSSLGKVGFFDVTFDSTRIDEKVEKITQFITKKTYNQTEFLASLQQGGEQPKCHITGGVLYVDYQKFLLYIKEYIEALAAGSTMDHLSWIAKQYPAAQMMCLYPLDKQAKKLLNFS